MIFYLGTHKAHWLADAGVPLMVSYRQLRNRVSLPRAVAPWVLDSGGFSEIAQHGRWTVAPATYAAAVELYAGEIGNLEWAAPMDWMCERSMVEKTGLTVAEHQRRTTNNYLELREIAPSAPWVPVLQGDAIEDYLRHVDGYDRADVDLAAEKIVGVGSVCRRQGTEEGAGIVRSLWASGIKNLHGFGFKTMGLATVGAMMASADSMAWSYRARRSEPLDGCTHKSCANCMTFALEWRQKVIDAVPDEFQAALV